MTWTRENAVREWQKATSKRFSMRSSQLKAIDKGLQDYINNLGPAGLITAYCAWRRQNQNILPQSTTALYQLLQFADNHRLDLESHFVKKLIDSGQYVRFLKTYPCRPYDSVLLGFVKTSLTSNLLYPVLTRLDSFDVKVSPAPLMDAQCVHVTPIPSTLNLNDIQGLRDFVNRANWQNATSRCVYTTQLTGCSFVIRKNQSHLQFAHFKPSEGMNGLLWTRLKTAFQTEIEGHPPTMWIYGYSLNNGEQMSYCIGNGTDAHSANILGGVNINGEYKIYAQILSSNIANPSIVRLSQIYPDYVEDLIA